MTLLVDALLRSAMGARGAYDGPIIKQVGRPNMTDISREALLHKIQLAFGNNNLVLVRRLTVMLIALYPESREAILLMAALRLSVAGEYSRDQVWQRIGVSTYGSVEAAFIVARCLEHMNLISLSERIYKYIITIRPEMYLPWFRLGCIYANEKQPFKAARYLRRLSYLDPSDHRHVATLINCLRRLGKFNEAMQFFHSLRHQSSISPLTFKAVTLCALSAGDEAADNLLDTALLDKKFEKSGFGRLVSAIRRLDDREIKDAYSEGVAGNIYVEPLLQAYHMRKRISTYTSSRLQRACATDAPKISLSSLSSFGRFSHTMRNYVSAKLFAGRFGFEVETPEWLGHYFFELSDPFISKSPRVFVQEPNQIIAAMQHSGVECPLNKCTNYDLFSPDGNIFRNAYKQEILTLLKVRPYWKDLYSISLEYFASLGRTLVAVHIRLGDMELPVHMQQYGSVKMEYYVNWLTQIWGTLDRPVLYIASDEPEKAKAALAVFRPLTILDTAFSDDILGGIHDFYILMNSDVVATSRGSFGPFAAALNTKAVTFFRSDEQASALVPFEPWGP